MSKLLPGENLVLKDHPHWITVAKGVVAPVILLIVIAVADFTVLGPGRFYTPNLRKLLSLAVIAVALLWLIVLWLRRQSTSYTLTDQRIKIESGVFGREEKVIPIDRVQDCTTRLSIIGRIFGYGTVEIDAAGAQGAEVLDHLPNPGNFRDQVFMESERRRGVPAPVAVTVPVASNPSGL